MTDRELLELAAKATGFEIFETAWCRGFFCRYVGEEDKDGERAHIPWNPLADDGDALRLAMDLRIDVTLLERETIAESFAGGHYERYIEDAVEDRGAATRRAIVRAAAEIGRTMP